MSHVLHQGDCLHVMGGMPPASVDAIVTDPPYGIRFMGKAWDGADIERRAAKRRAAASSDPQATAMGGHKSNAAEAGKYDLAPEAMRAFQQFSEEWAREALRVLKPGGYLISFASPRTYHRMVSGIEDAGFEIRDTLMWLFGSGFPKSHNGPWGGTALKPAHEPILLARKPLIGTVGANWTAHGTGALNIDGCRVPMGDEVNPSIARRQGATNHLSDRPAAETEAEGRMASRQSREAYRAERAGEALGRWPANVIHDGSDEVVAAFPESNGSGPARTLKRGTRAADGWGMNTQGNDMAALRDAGAGSAARFFYCAKASREDRNEGCAGLEKRTGGMVSNTSGQHITRRDGGAPPPRENHHPTVKPTDLMRYLVRLLTPTGGVVLDPFMGSGSTGKAAVLEGYDFIGIELDADYLEIARARIAFAARLGHQPSLLEAA